MNSIISLTTICGLLFTAALISAAASDNLLSAAAAIVRH